MAAIRPCECLTWRLRAVYYTGRGQLCRALPLNAVDLRPAPTCRQSSTEAKERMMPFQQYRKLKQSLKVKARLTGIPAGLLGMATSSAINISLNPRMFEMTPEEVKPILGMDPILFSVLCGMGSGVVGYMVGANLFTKLWALIYRKDHQNLQKRENDFLQRLQKHRFSEFNKYDDDYYGDKVTTLSDYRQWVRQQQKKKDAAQLVAKTTTAPTHNSTT